MANKDDAQVQIRFTIDATATHPSYTDAVYVPLADYPKMRASGEIERLKTERYNTWLAHLADQQALADAAPVPTPVPAVEAARQVLTDALAQLGELKHEG